MIDEHPPTAADAAKRGCVTIGAAIAAIAACAGVGGGLTALVPNLPAPGVAATAEGVRFCFASLRTAWLFHTMTPGFLAAAAVIVAGAQIAPRRRKRRGPPLTGVAKGIVLLITLPFAALVACIFALCAVAAFYALFVAPFTQFTCATLTDEVVRLDAPARSWHIPREEVADVVVDTTEEHHKGRRYLNTTVRLITRDGETYPSIKTHHPDAATAANALAARLAPEGAAAPAREAVPARAR